MALVIVVTNDAADRVDDERVLPTGQLDYQSFGFVAVELGSAVLRRSEVEPLTGSGHGGGVMHSRLQRDNV